MTRSEFSASVGASLRWWSRRSTPLVERWIKRKLFVTEEPDADARAIPNAATAVFLPSLQELARED